MRLFLLLSLSLSAHLLFAQQNDSSPAEGNESLLKKKISRAEIHFKNEDYESALSNLNEVLALSPENAEVHFKMGLCYFNLNNDSLALDEFEKANKLRANKLPEVNFYLALSEHYNGLFDSALVHYQKEMERAILQTDSEYSNKIEKRIKECISGKALLILKDTTIRLNNLGKNINTAFQESSIYLSSDTLMYLTSTKPSKTGLVSENIYSSQKINGSWSETASVGKPINTDGNDAILYLSSNGLYLYLYADVNGGDIYYSTKNESGWSKPLAIADSINSTKMESSLCVSADSSTIYFISNRSGSGGKDIFYSTKRGNTWSSPLNMSSIVNSEYDEETPFLHNDTLYFSSQGHNSVGGFDVFKTYKQNGSWINPINLGFPVNSPYDELSYTIYNNLQHLVTDRPGGEGNTDIYEVVRIEKKPIVIAKEEKTVANDSSLITQSNAKDGMSVKEKAVDIYSRLQAITLNESVDLIALLGLKPVLFEFDNAMLNAEAKYSLDSIIRCFKILPDFNLEIKAYTDCKGSDNYNLMLSEKRALAIKNYIHDKNAPLSENIKVKGLGENYPLVDCDCDDKSKTKNICTSEENLLNRRAEIKVSKTNTKSLTATYYVVLESEGSDADAERTVKKLKKQNENLDLVIIQNNRKSWFHVCINKTYSLDSVKKEVSNYKKSGFQDAWFIRVK